MTDPQLNRAEAARVGRKFLDAPWSDRPRREDDGELTEYDARWMLDREIDAALLADNLTHGHRRERMPDAARLRDDAVADQRAQLRSLARIRR
jgi:hypothetical protein